MSNFALYTNSSQSDIIASLNYALCNLGTFDANVIANIAANVANTTITSANVVTANTTTGVLSTIHTGTINYLYNYVNVKYANNATGSSGFSSNCTNKSYYGVHNTVDGSISSNPVDYQWKQVVGGFGTTKGLYSTNAGGGIVYFTPGTVAPSTVYTPVLDDQPISLQSLANSIVVTNTINPGAVTNVGIATQTITTNNIGLGVITANLLAANLIIAKDIVSTNATLGNTSSPGYWMQANTGSASFGGNINIGNNLTVGANAQIGGNLQVSGLITSGVLNNNTVNTVQLVANSATTTGAVNNTGYTLTNPAMYFSGFDGTYYNYNSANLVVNGGIVTATTANVTNIVSGYIDVSGWTNTNGIFGVPQIFGELYRTTDGITFTPISQTFITTPAGQQFNGVVETQQTLLPVRLSAVSIVDQFTISSVTNVGYFWVVGAYVGQTSNIAPLQPNLTISTYGVTVTNYKR